MNVVRFRTLVRTVLLSAGPFAAVACSSDDYTVMPDRAQCVDLESSSRYGALTLAPNVDGVVLGTRGPVVNAAGYPGAVTPVAPAQRLPTLGTPCATANDKEACAKKIDALMGDPNSGGWQIRISSCGDCGSTTLQDLGVITAGDEVRLATLDELVRAALPIESRHEAANILMLKGYALDCDENNARHDSDGWTFKKTSRSCSGEVNESFRKVLDANGQVIDGGTHKVREADSNCIEGRRPANLAATGVSWLASLGACFSEIAHMEAAAVLAFDVLEGQLRDLGAPRALRDRAARARADEVAHAGITERLAHRFGQAPKTPQVGAASGQTAETALFRLALENAVEGCVREAYGAVVAAYQGANAADPEVRAAFAQIALDEAQHAELSFDIDAWVMPRLDAGERRRIEAAKTQAWIDLAASCDVEPAPEVVRVAGIPTAREARALLAELVWAATATAVAA